MDIQKSLLITFLAISIFDKMTAGGHFGWDDNVNYRIRPRYLDDQCMHACVKFEERSVNPSKVIMLTTKL